MAPKGRVFRDRAHAGRVLAALLEHHRGAPGLLVLGLPRGGVPVAAEVAAALAAPMDVFLVRKLGVPGQEELAMGAIASGGVRVLNSSVVDALGITPDVVDWMAAREGEELARREERYRCGRAAPDVTGRMVVVVDDGLATGSTMRAAVTALRLRRAARIVVAVPVGARPTCRSLRTDADEVVCAHAPSPFRAVGEWYEDFSPTGDDEVTAALGRMEEDGS